MSPDKWIRTTNAIGVISKSGRYGGGGKATIEEKNGEWKIKNIRNILIE
jgi:hypothetical protein